MLRIFLLILCCFPVCLQAQTFTVSGTIRDKRTGEVLIGASAILLEMPRSGMTSNSYGFYSLSARPGNYTLVVSFTGYRADTLKIVLDRDIRLPVGLIAGGTELQEVVISSIRRNDNVTRPLMGVQKLSTSDIRNVPVIFGEKDVLKTIQLLPGIQAAGDGNSGFFVRGGGADQNLILLDEATVYNPSHLLGFFSTFNSDAIKDITVYKGGMPAEYGGRLSSVVDIKMNDGNNKEDHFGGGIGLISTRLNAEGPIVKDKGSFSISGRRTYADLFLRLSPDSNINSNSLYFYDLNVKANYKLNERNRFYLSGYFGRDALSFGGAFGIDYGNATGTARWNHVFNSRLFSNTSFIYSDYSYKIKINSNNNDIDITSDIRDLDLKEDLQYYVNTGNKIDFGFNAIRHAISPGVITASATSSFNSLRIQDKYSLENAAYISHEWSPGKVHLNYGLRLSAFYVFGPGNFYTYDAAGNAVDTAHYRSGQLVTSYFDPEPRFSMSYTLNDEASFKWAYDRNVQVLHLLSNSTSANPTDLWLPSSNIVRPGIADQVSIGYYRNFHDNQYEFSAETYYKAMKNQIDYKNGAQLIANENVESQLLFGKGRAYGLELFIKKKAGKLTGWISYTLSRTELQIDGVNEGKWYPARQDRTHDISIVGIYQANKKWTLSATWVYYTGNAVTFPSGKYRVNDQTAFYYTERNAYRMPAYHRMDVAATLLGKTKRRFGSSWTFSVYNLYGRENAYSIVFQDDPADSSKTQAIQYALFRFVPSVTYNFKF
ncbi:MAG: TonB-dependent receptor [Bacteroidota bacterium]|nr:TonB-dependent receptor [Bacteroidota bacterium]